MAGGLPAGVGERSFRLEAVEQCGYSGSTMTRFRVAATALCLVLSAAFVRGAGTVPLPEHPRPDFERPDWLNLNGWWDFRFDTGDAGQAGQWQQGDTVSGRSILVPFPWGSPLSGVPDEAEIAWYRRSFEVPSQWEGRRVFLVVGASDWRTTAWVDGNLLGSHQGGYTPFEFELTPWLRPGTQQQLVIRVDDRARPFKLEGKQGYGNARGIWQTVYLEARGRHPVRSVRFVPRLEPPAVDVTLSLLEPSADPLNLTLAFVNGEYGNVEAVIPAGTSTHRLTVPMPAAQRWELEDPYLYYTRLTVGAAGHPPDTVSAYFGMREIGVVRLPGSGHPYVALNGRPVYLQMTLDQAYHPEGYYAFPDDAFVRDEVLRTLRLGLNTMRVHVKIPLPRKLYWADRLGLLIMADVPNSWGEPDADMRREAETALRGMIERDFNHPSIFSWVIFNETWGLETKGQGYTEDTQRWVESMVRLAKEQDPTRLVEDNSPHKFDHVITDLNTWHSYLPGWAWEAKLDEVTRQTYPGSSWNFVRGRTQGDQPLLNSECGNVWGYEGSTGDVDWSWDYHLMLNAFRRRLQIGGWLYTEHHDVINEWNGYYRYDRSEKYSGLEDLVPGMSLRDLHTPVYVIPGQGLSLEAAAGTTLQMPLWLSVHRLDPSLRKARLRFALYGWDDLGRAEEYWGDEQLLELREWSSRELPAVAVPLPPTPALLIFAVLVEEPGGSVLHRNFTTILTAPVNAQRDEIREEEDARLRILRFAPGSHRASEWSGPYQGEVLDGLKVSGTGSGYYEYQVQLPADLNLKSDTAAFLRMELSSRRLLGRDAPAARSAEGDYMRGRGTHDPSLNRNAYPMTDEDRFPTRVRIRLNGIAAAVFDLPDDPADHRGILSWHSQLRDRFLREAGTYGYLVDCPLPAAVLDSLRRGARSLEIRLEVDSSLPGGLAVYGERFGRFPMDPSVVFVDSN